jgi:nucleoid DNA-binding protein
MASYIKAVSRYRPRIRKRGTATKEQMAEWIAERTLLTTGQAKAVLSDYAEGALFFFKNRQDVNLEGLGKLSVDIGVDGRLAINFRPNDDFVKRLNAEFDKSAESIEQAENVGKSRAEIVALWNAEFPADPITG